MNNKNYQYYSNKKNYDNICVPTKKDTPNNFLVKLKFLSEFSTEEEKKKVLYNLGIAQELNKIILIINKNIEVPDLDKFVTLSQFLEKIQDFNNEFGNLIESLKEEDLNINNRLESLEEELSISEGMLFPTMDFDPETGILTVRGLEQEVLRIGYDEENALLIIRL